MGNFCRKFLFILLLLGISAQAKDDSNSYYDAVFLGEKDAGQYEGPVNSLVSFDEHLATKTFLDDLFEEDFFLDLSSPAVGVLKESWFNELPGMSSCPNYYLKDNIEYIRYLYRLITISYLFESLKEHAKVAYSFGIDNKVCTLDWKDVFGKCSPETLDMKTFVRRTRSRYLIGYDVLQNPQFKSIQKRSWISEKRDLVSDNSLETIVDYRLRKYCEKNGCKDLDEAGLFKFLKNTCVQDKEHIQTFCSEKDSLFGISETSIPRRSFNNF